MKTRKGVEELPKVNGRWIEAVVGKETEPKAQESPLRVYFTGRAYCQISNPREAGLAVELITWSGVLEPEDVELQRQPQDLRVGGTL